MSYIRPEDVKSPRRQFTLVAILDDGKTCDRPTGENSVSISIGRWKDSKGTEEPILGIRWNGDDANPIGNPQSRGLPTWFVVPRHLRQMILDRMPLSPRKRAVLQEVFGDDLFTGPDGAGWVCDKCGERIRTAQHGVVEWVSVHQQNHWEGRRMFIVHHLSASPLTKQRGDDGCYLSQAEQRRTGTTTDWVHLDELLGPDGLMQMLEMIADNEVPVQDILETIQRLHLPRYERARPYINSAVADGLFEPNLRRGFYWQQELERVLAKYSKQNRA